MGVKFGTEEGTFGPLLRAKFHPPRCNVSPLRGENPQNRPLSKLNNQRFALRAMLPVNDLLWIVRRWIVVFMCSVVIVAWQQYIYSESVVYAKVPKEISSNQESWFVIAGH